ncbi:MAG TPA: hypothetical protein VFQ61_27970 [Polyangiaceae bacterium]|nr:hypothetical protein [Polyangiaceae bacterium]
MRKPGVQWFTKAAARGSAFSVLALIAGHARAQAVAQEITAEAAFVEGVQLMKANRCPEALERFKESQELDPASGTLLDIAFCEAALGRTASAWLAYRKALTLAVKSEKPQHAQIAREQSEKLAPELPRLTLLVSDAGRTWKLRLDGAPLAVSGASPLFVDPGKHVLEGAYHEQSFRLPFEVAAREQKVLTVPEPPPDTSHNPTPRQSSSAESSSTESPRSQSAPAPANPESARNVSVGEQDKADIRTRAWLASGFGAATLLVGVGLFTHARLRFDAADCPNNQCVRDRDLRASNSARTEAYVSYGVAAGGVALLGLGAAWFVGSKPGRPESLRVRAKASVAACGVALEGSF